MKQAQQKTEKHTNCISVNSSPFLTSSYANYQIVPYTSPKIQKITTIKKRSFKKLLHHLPSFKSMINIPILLIKSIPSLISSSFLILILYLFLSSVYILQKDISHKIVERRNAIKALVQQGSYNYYVNKCEPHQRVPALQKMCSKWECQMSRSIDSVEITRIVAEVVGEFLNSFVERIGVKTLVYGLVIFIVYLYFKRK